MKKIIIKITLDVNNLESEIVQHFPNLLEQKKLLEQIKQRIF